MNLFGGDWTEAKMDIVVKYAKAYLKIMNRQPWVQTIYFDGFAGSGYINSEDSLESIKGTALRILEITDPKPFDLYYFVEKDLAYADALSAHIDQHPLKARVKVVPKDANKKLRDLARYLKDNNSRRALVFIDPYGMEVDAASIETLTGLGVDLWILVPTGIGVNRMLTTNGDISTGWMAKLERFLGFAKADIRNHFYRKATTHTLFGEESRVEKEKGAAMLAGELYAKKLKQVFKYVSMPFVLRNTQNAIMYHLMMGTNNASGIGIANDVIEPNNKLPWPNPRSSGRK